MPPAQTKTSGLAAATARAALAASLLMLAAMIGASKANAEKATYGGNSADGSAVFFSTAEKLVPGDTDNRADVYMRTYDSVEEEYVTRQVSTGPTGGNNAFDADFEKVSADGTKVFFSTGEQLVAADTDGRSDVYVRNPDEGTTSLVSVAAEGCQGGSCGNGPAQASFAGATANGTIVLFVTTERFAVADTDSSVDIYARYLESGETSLVSAGGASCAPTCGNEDFLPALRGASPDGSTAFFTTAEQLTSDDTDTVFDLYSRVLPNGPTTRISQGAAECAPGCGNSNSFPVVFEATSSDGSKVFFETSEGLVAADTDEANDVYLRSGGTTSLVSAGSEGAPANHRAISSDGTQALFVTSESLVGGDTNGASDVYKWAGGAPILVTSGTCTQGSECGASFNSATADAATLFFTTTEQLAGGDTDSSADIYRVATTGGAAEVLVSAGGNGSPPATFRGSSADGEKVYFTTAEALLPGPGDEDSDRDLFLRDIGAATTTLSTPAGLCPLVGGCPVVFSSNSTDGEHAFFTTEERLDAADVDSQTDVYERDVEVEPAKTRLVSRGNTEEIGPPTPVLTGTSPASPGSSTTPAILGQASAGASIKIYKTFDCTGAPVAIGTGSQLGSPGIPVSIAPGSTTNFRATATDGEGDTSPCSVAVSYTHQEEAPPPPPPPPPPGEEEGGGTDGGDSGTNNKLPKFYGGGIAFVAPLTRITFGPAFKTRKRRVAFRFIDSTGQPGTRFICKLQRRLSRRALRRLRRRSKRRPVKRRWTRSRWRGCQSPKKFKRLRVGRYRFMVKGRNAAGTWEERKVKRGFKVVRRQGSRKLRRGQR